MEWWWVILCKEKESYENGLNWTKLAYKLKKQLMLEQRENVQKKL